MKVGEEEVEINGSVGVKQGDNLGPILFILLIQSVASALDKKRTFATLNFRKHPLKKDGNIAYNPSVKKKVSKSTIGTWYSLSGNPIMLTMLRMYFCHGKTLKRFQNSSNYTSLDFELQFNLVIEEMMAN